MTMVTGGAFSPHSIPESAVAVILWQSCMAVNGMAREAIRRPRGGDSGKQLGRRSRTRSQADSLCMAGAV